MIFETVDKIKNRDEFKEKILIYIRLVEVFAERYGLQILNTSECDESILNELNDIGIIKSTNDLSILKNVLTQDYQRFVSCVKFAVDNKKTIGALLDKLNNKKRLELQKQEIEADKPNFVDFFAGAGGLSCGFVQAGFKVSFANDFEDVCIRTYRFNHPEISSNKVLNEDIRNIADNISDYVNEAVDVVVGGPPCQGFSSANQQRIIDDPRNELYKYYIKTIRTILPKFVVMENVRGMMKVADQVVEDYQTIKEKRNDIEYGYVVGYRLLNAVNFSVAQSRERLIYIAIRTDVAKNKNITPNDIFNQIENFNSDRKYYTLREALEYIKPLDAPRNKNKTEIDDEKTGKIIDVNIYRGDENEYLRLINGGRIIPFVFNHKARYLNDVNYEIYRLLNQGDDASDAKISDIMPYKNRLYCFKDKYYKLIADRPSRTITAHLKMDCHSHIHPYQIRALTPREAARCQSFPDDYLFLGAYLKTYMQIGNAVPVLMAQQIATIIKKYL